MNKTITVEKNVLDNILDQLTKVRKDLKTLAKRLDELTPEYGSDTWWDKETRDALREVEKGNVVKFDSVEELIKDLHS